MADITIRNLPDSAKETLRVKATKAGISLEAYACQVLQEASRSHSDQPVSLLRLSEKYFGDQDGVDLKLPEHGSQRPVVEF